MTRLSTYLIHGICVQLASSTLYDNIYPNQTSDLMAPYNDGWKYGYAWRNRATCRHCFIKSYYPCDVYLDHLKQLKTNPKHVIPTKKPPCRHCWVRCWLYDEPKPRPRKQWPQNTTPVPTRPPTTPMPYRCEL